MVWQTPFYGNGNVFDYAQLIELQCFAYHSQWILSDGKFDSLVHGICFSCPLNDAYAIRGNSQIAGVFATILSISRPSHLVVDVLASGESAVLCSINVGMRFFSVLGIYKSPFCAVQVKAMLKWTEQCLHAYADLVDKAVHLMLHSYNITIGVRCFSFPRRESSTSVLLWFDLCYYRYATPGGVSVFNCTLIVFSKPSGILTHSCSWQIVPHFTIFLLSVVNWLQIFIQATASPRRCSLISIDDSMIHIELTRFLRDVSVMRLWVFCSAAVMSPLYGSMRSWKLRWYYDFCLWCFSWRLYWTVLVVSIERTSGARHAMSLVLPILQVLFVHIMDVCIIC